MLIHALMQSLLSKSITTAIVDGMKLQEGVVLSGDGRRWTLLDLHVHVAFLPEVTWQPSSC